MSVAPRGCRDSAMNDYFLISVSTRRHLELCLEHRLAGFSNSINGLWAYLDIDEGDYVSFLYGARLYHLYRIAAKRAYANAEQLGPWPAITFRSGRTYYFPFRVHLQRVRHLEESLVRPEFAFVGENLFLRGGYRKTHFQSDQAMLEWAFQAGRPVHESPPQPLPAPAFEPLLTLRRNSANPPRRYHLRENILQALLRRALHSRLLDILDALRQRRTTASDWEILSEKALSEGFADLLIKPRAAQGPGPWILVEVKASRVTRRHFGQLANYLRQTPAAVGGVLIGRAFPRRWPSQTEKPILAWRYDFGSLEDGPDDAAYSFDTLLRHLRLTRVR